MINLKARGKKGERCKQTVSDGKDSKIESSHRKKLMWIDSEFVHEFPHVEF